MIAKANSLVDVHGIFILFFVLDFGQCVNTKNKM